MLVENSKLCAPFLVHGLWDYLECWNVAKKNSNKTTLVNIL